MNILITGASGNIGGFILKHLNQQGHKVIGLGRKNIKNDENFWECDLLSVSKEEISDFLEKNNINTIIHCAGILKVTTIEEYHLNSFILNKFLTLKSSPNIKYIVIGSAGEYGFVESNLTTEKTLPSPASMYGASKFLQTTLCSYYKNEFNLDITVLRLFNILFPSLPTQSLVGHVIAESTKGNDGVININDDKIVRDFIDLRDFAKLVEKVINSSKSDLVYNAGSGINTSYEKLISTTFEILKEHNLSLPKVNISGKEEAFSKAVCDNSKAKRDFNWSLEYNLKDSIYWCLKENKII